MKHPFPFLSLALTLLITLSNILSGQYTKVEEVSLFGTRLNSPIVTEIQRSGDKITFDVMNKSYFIYDLTLNFNNLQNLSPKIFTYSAKIHFGRNRLFVLDITDKDQPINYTYNIKYSLEIPDKVDQSFPYLVPIGNGKTVTLKETRTETGITYYLNQFKLSQGDTVFASRKGIVTALPDNKTEVERIFKTFSLEVLHQDGSFSIYLGLDPEVNFCKLGEAVYPGEPIGIIGGGLVLKFYVTVPKEDNKLEALPILYSDQNGNPISSQSIRNIEVFYPISIIQKELTSRELKRYQKKVLYKD